MDYTFILNSMSANQLSLLSAVQQLQKTLDCLLFIVVTVIVALFIRNLIKG